MRVVACVKSDCPFHFEGEGRKEVYPAWRLRTSSRGRAGIRRMTVTKT